MGGGVRGEAYVLGNDLFEGSSEVRDSKRWVARYCEVRCKRVSGRKMIHGVCSS